MATVDPMALANQTYDIDEVSDETANSEVKSSSVVRAAAEFGIDSPVLLPRNSDSNESSPTFMKQIDSIVTSLVSLVQIIAQVLKNMLTGISRNKVREGASSQEPKSASNGDKSAPQKTSSSSETTSQGNSKTTPTSSESTSRGAVSGATAHHRLQAIQDERGVVTIRTADKYVLKVEGREAAWSITGPDGKTTRIFGDPHVAESDGDRWDFKPNSTFVFGRNKVTVETVPVKNGQTVTGRITVYSGSERVTVTGIDKNKPVIKAASGDGREHDDSLNDGIRYQRAITPRGESWTTVRDGKKRVMGGV